MTCLDSIDVREGKILYKIKLRPKDYRIVVSQSTRKSYLSLPVSSFSGCLQRGSGFEEGVVRDKGVGSTRGIKWDGNISLPHWFPFHVKKKMLLSIR